MSESLSPEQNNGVLLFRSDSTPIAGAWKGTGLVCPATHILNNLKHKPDATHPLVIKKAVRNKYQGSTVVLRQNIDNLQVQNGTVINSAISDCLGITAQFVTQRGDILLRALHLNSQYDYSLATIQAFLAQIQQHFAPPSLNLGVYGNEQSRASMLTQSHLLPRDSWVYQTLVESTMPNTNLETLDLSFGNMSPGADEIVYVTSVASTVRFGDLGSVTNRNPRSVVARNLGSDNF